MLPHRGHSAALQQTVRCALLVTLLWCAQSPSQTQPAGKVRALEQTAPPPQTQPGKVRALQQTVPPPTPQPAIKVPPLYWSNLQEAAATLKRLDLQPNFSDQNPGNIVIDQKPAPETQVNPRTVVELIMGRPRLTLSAIPTADIVTAKPNQQLAFSLKLEPPLPQRQSTTFAAMAYIPPPLQARYTLRWNGDSAADTQTLEPTSESVLQLQHEYTAAGTYHVSALAQVGPYPAESNTVPVNVENPEQPPAPATRYKIEAIPHPDHPQVNQQVRVDVLVSPAPPAGTLYLFNWGGMAPESTTSSSAVHSYSAPGEHLVQVILMIDRRAVAATRVPIQVSDVPPPPPPPPIGLVVVAIVAVVAVVIGIYKLIRGRLRRLKPLHLPGNLSITAKPGLVRHEIQHAEQIRKRAGIRVRFGLVISAVSMTPQTILKKRSASDA